MAWTIESNWNPTRLMEVAGLGRHEHLRDASKYRCRPRVHQANGNRQGPHVLATDWVGTHLARWFGLSTFDIAILTLGAATFFRCRGVARHSRGRRSPRSRCGDPWGKSGLQLDVLVNPEDVTRNGRVRYMTLDCDRHHHDLAVRKANYDNIYLSSEGVEPGKRRLIAMDHGLCFIRSGEDLTPRLANIDKVRDEHVYGLFPENPRKLREDIIDGCPAAERDGHRDREGND